jgi:hypothetical protein
MDGHRTQIRFGQAAIAIWKRPLLGGICLAAMTLLAFVSPPAALTAAAKPPPSPPTVDRRVPYQASQFASHGGETNSATATLPAVPAGKRLVVEYLTVLFEVGDGQQVSCFVQANDATAGFGDSAFQLPLQARAGATGGSDRYVGSQRVLMFVGAGNALSVTCLTNTVGAAQMTVSAAGYLEDQ